MIEVFITTLILSGVHYWYAATLDMSCDNFFPVFLLYNGGVLNAFGWAFQADLSSSRFEHPTTSSFAVSARFYFFKHPTAGGKFLSLSGDISLAVGDVKCLCNNL